MEQLVNNNLYTRQSNCQNNFLHKHQCKHQYMTQCIHYRNCCNHHKYTLLLQLLLKMAHLP